MTRKVKIKMLLIAIVLCFSCFLTCFTPITIQSVYASSVDVVGGYTDVMEDLQKDKYFSPAPDCDTCPAASAPHP